MNEFDKYFYDVEDMADKYGLSLSMRTKNVLAEHDITSAEKLAKLHPKTAAELHGSGAKTVAEIAAAQEILKTKGIHVHHELDPFEQLSSRAHRVMRLLGVTKLDRLGSVVEEDIWKTQGAGKKVVEEILAFQQKHLGKRR